MPVYDFRCPLCKEVREIRVSNWHDALNLSPRCEHDYTPMEKVPPSPAFKILGYSAKNGYSRGAKG